MPAAGYNGVTSTSSIPIGNGPKSYAVNDIAAFIVGDRIRAIANAFTWQEGQITSITSTMIYVAIDTFKGNGTYNS